MKNIYFAKSNEHYRIYGSEFVRDLRYGESRDLYPTVAYPSEYHGENVIRFAPSQRDELTPYAQKKLTEEWVRYLTENRLPLKEVQVVTSLSQRVFDALCLQSSIESLRIKLLNCKDISKVEELKSLKAFFIECGTKIEDISPITKLQGLEILILGDTEKIIDYSPVKELKHLKVFSVCRYQSSLKPAIKMKSEQFLEEMPSLEYVDLTEVKIS